MAHMSSQVLYMPALYLLLLWYQAIKQLCEKILKLLLLGNTVSMIKHHCAYIKCLLVDEVTVFTSSSRIILSQYNTSRPHCQAKWTVNISEVEDHVITLCMSPWLQALYDHQPKISDVQLVAAWTVVMETAHMRLMR